MFDLQALCDTMGAPTPMCSSPGGCTDWRLGQWPFWAAGMGMPPNLFDFLCSLSAPAGIHGPELPTGRSPCTLGIADPLASALGGRNGVPASHAPRGWACTSSTLMDHSAPQEHEGDNLGRTGRPPPRPLSTTYHPPPAAGADAGAASSTIFVINEVLNASGGRTGCFLYRGTLASAAPRSRTPDACCPPPRSSSPSAAGAGGALLGAGGESPSADLAAYEGQEMTLYMSYEEASPKMRQRVAGRAGGYGGGALGAPWRVALRDANDDLVYCARGLPLQVGAYLHLPAAAGSVLQCWRRRAAGSCPRLVLMPQGPTTQQLPNRTAAAALNLNWRSLPTDNPRTLLPPTHCHLSRPT